MTRTDTAVAVACMAILLCSAYAAPPFIPKAYDSSVSIRAVPVDDEPVGAASNLDTIVCPAATPIPVSAATGREYVLQCADGDIDFASAALACAERLSVLDNPWMLAKIENAAELTTVANLAFGIERVWIGINDIDVEVTGPHPIIVHTQPHLVPCSVYLRFRPRQVTLSDSDVVE